MGSNLTGETGAVSGAAELEAVTKLWRRKELFVCVCVRTRVHSGHYMGFDFPVKPMI